MEQPGLYDLVRNVQLPDDLMRADTNISITMATIQFFAQSVEKNAKKIQEYIANQLQSDLEYDQMTLKEYIDPFTGEPVKKGRKK